MKKKLLLRIGLVFIIVLLVSTMGSMAQRLQSGAQDLCFFSSVDETDQPYAIYIPQNFDESKEYPLVVFLHGAMSNHRLGLERAFGQGNIQGKEFTNPNRVTVVTDLEATRTFPQLKNVDYIVAAPYARGTAGYQGIPEQDVYEMLDDIHSRFNIDKDRVYLTGLSMGGGGTLWVGLTRPDVWAAIAPCCPAPPNGTDELSPNAINLPVHLFIGDQDFLYETAQVWKQKFEENSAVFNYVEYPGIGHNSWEYAYENGFIFDWFSQFKRDLYPSQVKFNTRVYKYNKAYWVTFDKLIPGELASIDARFSQENNLEITTGNLDAFTLHLEEHPQFNAKAKVSVTIDGKELSIKTPGTLSFTKSTNGWVNQRNTPGLNSKKQGAEGPLVAAASSNHIYVYGTAGNPTPEELEVRKQQAIKAADWSVYREQMGRVMIFPRVISDQAVRQSDIETSNLVLFGTRETNSIIEKYADELPMHLDADANDYSLLYIYPMNGRYLLINSGQSWWTLPKGGDDGNILSSVLNLKVDEMRGLKDFILYKEGSGNIISEGYFDSEWLIPSNESDKLKKTGVVTLK